MDTFEVDRMLNRKEASRFLGITVHTLENYGARMGPLFKKASNGRAFYRMSDLMAFKERNKAPWRNTPRGRYRPRPMDFNLNTKALQQAENQTRGGVVIGVAQLGLILGIRAKNIFERIHRRRFPIPMITIPGAKCLIWRVSDVKYFLKEKAAGLHNELAAMTAENKTPDLVTS